MTARWLSSSQPSPVTRFRRPAPVPPKTSSLLTSSGAPTWSQRGAAAIRSASARAHCALPCSKAASSVACWRARASVAVRSPVAARRRRWPSRTTGSQQQTARPAATAQAQCTRVNAAMRPNRAKANSPIAISSRAHSARACCAAARAATLAGSGAGSLGAGDPKSRGRSPGSFGIQPRCRPIIGA